MMDAESGRTGVRMVKLYSLAYQSARKFQIRLASADLQDTGAPGGAGGPDQL